MVHYCSRATGQSGGSDKRKGQIMLKRWNEMNAAERAAERALPKEERQHRALLRSLDRPRSPVGRLSRSKRGTWGRALTTGCRRGCVAALTRSECQALSLEPGPGNL